MAKFKLYNQVNVTCPGSVYPVMIGRNALDDASLLESMITSQQVLIVTNTQVAPLYLEPVLKAFASKQCDVVVLEDGEVYKNRDSLFKIYDTLIHNKHHRDTTVLALGGGVISDLAGFAASTYQRGVPCVHIPTTLLAQIDAAIGGKTAINHSQGKNMIGSFYQPQAVLIDLNTLNTLPDREFRAGLAEMIKYALLAGEPLMQQLITVLNQGITTEHPQLAELVTACCRIKAQIVAEDEKETGQRALLNLGHTFAHALEATTHYQYWLHGEAVAIGLYCAALMSHSMELIDASLVRLIEHMLQNAGLPHHIPRFIDLQQLRLQMSLDKKMKQGLLRFVLLRNPGDCYLEEQVTEACLHNTLLKALEGE